MDQLSHEFEDGRGAGGVVVPELNGSLQDGHVGGVTATEIKEFPDFPGQKIRGNGIFRECSKAGAFLGSHLKVTVFFLSWKNSLL